VNVRVREFKTGTAEIHPILIPEVAKCAALGAEIGAAYQRAGIKMLEPHIAQERDILDAGFLMEEAGIDLQARPERDAEAAIGACERRAQVIQGQGGIGRVGILGRCRAEWKRQTGCGPP